MATAMGIFWLTAFDGSSHYGECAHLRVIWSVSARRLSSVSWCFKEGSGALESLIRESVYSKSFQDDGSVSWDRGLWWVRELVLTAVRDLPKEMASSGMFVDPKLFLLFVLFLCVQKSCLFPRWKWIYYFFALGKCLRPSMQWVSSWHLRPLHWQPFGVHPMLLFWAVTPLLRDGGLCQDTSKLHRQ